MHGATSKVLLPLTPLLACLLLAPLPALGETGPGDTGDSRLSGWAGLKGGATLGASDDPNLIRVGLEMGAALRLSGSPFEVGGGLMLAICGGPPQGETYDSPGAPPFSVRSESRHLEVLPFAQGALRLGDSFAFYLGLGAGVANVRTDVKLSGAFQPHLDQHGQEGEVFDFPEGRTENVLTLRIGGGLEYTMEGAFRIFLEPLGLQTYHLERGTSLRLVLLAGFASVF